MQRVFRQAIAKVPGEFFLLSIVVFIIILSRLLGLFQSSELKLLDVYFRLRPLEKVDERIVIVAITEADIRKLSQYPISDRNIASALIKIQHQSPRAIGLDIVRDIPVGDKRTDIKEGHKKLVQVFKTSPNLWGIEKVIGRKSTNKINPPPVLKQLAQVASTDTIPDRDAVVRRTLLFPKTQEKKFLPNLGLAVAMTYLEKQGINNSPGEKNYLQLDKTLFIPMSVNNKGKLNGGSYVDVNGGGYQVLLNYRGRANSFKKVSLVDLLENRVPLSFFKDRVVLIGYEATSVKDEVLTPYSFDTFKATTYTSGVELNANIASMIISSVLDDRPLLKLPGELLEFILIIFATGFLPLVTLRWLIQNKQITIVKELFITSAIFSSSCLVLVGSSYLAFLNSWWIPVSSSIIGLSFSITSLVIYVLAKKAYDAYLLVIDSELQFKVATSAAGMETLRWNLQTDEIVISNNLCQLPTGNESTSVILNKHKLFHFIHTDDRDNLEKDIERAIEKKEEFIVELRIPKSGEDVWIKAKGKAIYDRDKLPVEITGLFWDISEYKMLERARHSSNHVWETLTKNSFEFVMIVNPDDWSINHIRSSEEKIFGYEIDELKRTLLLEHIASKDIDSVVKTLEELAPGAEVTKRYSVVCADDSTRVFESTFCNWTKEPLIGGIVINSHDITSLVQAQSDCANAVSRLQEYT